MGNIEEAQADITMALPDTAGGGDKRKGTSGGKRSEPSLHKDNRTKTYSEGGDT